MKIYSLPLHYKTHQRRYLVTLTFTLFICISLCSCNSSRRTFGNSSNWIPADFDPATTILLIQKNGYSGKEEQKMENYMHGHYPYKYEFVPLETIKGREDKYADTRLYKYALVISSRIYRTPNNGDTRWFGMTIFDFNFYNRAQGKNYPGTNKPSSYASMTFKPVINTIVEKFK